MQRRKIYHCQNVLISFVRFSLLLRVQRRFADFSIADRKNVESQFAALKMLTSLLALPYPNLN
jgi:hypothetical protein